MSFFNPRKNKSKWASIVIDGYTPGYFYDENALELATDDYIKKHAKALFASIHKTLSSDDEQESEEQYRLAEKEFGALAKIRRYVTKEQRKGVMLALDGFLRMEEKYKHPDRVPLEPIRSNKKQMKEDFWQVYGESEAMDIFSGKKK